MLQFQSRGNKPKKNERPTAVSAVKSRRGLFAGLSGLDWGRLRIEIVAAVFAVLWFGLWARAWHVQMIEGPRLASRANRQHMASELVTGRRGMIMDRNGQVMARSVEVRSIYAKPGEITDPVHAANVIGPILGIPPVKLYETLTQNPRKFIWLARKIDDQKAESIRRAGLSGIGLSKEYERFYPFKHMAGHLLGFVGMDDKGLEGIERSLDGQLASLPTRQIVQRDATGRRFYLNTGGNDDPGGKDITLTLDLQVQFFAEEAVAATVEEYGAKWGGILVVDVPTGDILGYAQYPFFNPNSYRDYNPAQYRNRLAADALEPGSTFKPFLMAAAMQERKVDWNTEFFCENGKWETKTITIRDTKSHGILPAHKIIRYSSNIGMAKIALSLGARTYNRYLHQLGFGAQTGLPLADSRGIVHKLKNWSEADTMSIGFGQSISVTALQMAQGYLTLANYGVYRPLRLVHDENAQVFEVPQRIFSEKVSKQVLEMMREAVEEDGTGKAARINGMQVAGKTGTAQKADRKAGTYGSGRLASFVGLTPADKPRYLIIVMIDEPSKNQYGGVVAAPAFRQVAIRSMAYRGHLPDVTFAEKPDKRMVAATESKRKYVRGLRLASELPALSGITSVADAEPIQTREEKVRRRMRTVPNVLGKSVRNAVEIFAQGGIVPELKGNGQHVIKQSPEPGSKWPDDDKNIGYVLWLSER